MYNSSGQIGEISVILSANTMTYNGTDGVGIIAKEASKYLKVSDNTLNNTVLRLNGNNSCSSEVTGNKMTITGKSADSKGNLPAILIDKIFPDGASPKCTALVQNNIIDNKNTLNLTGVKVEENGYNTASESTISGNTIKGFTESIRIYGNSGNAGIIEKFDVLNNKITGKIIDTSPAGRSVNTFSGNTNLSGGAVSPTSK